MNTFDAIQQRRAAKYFDPNHKMTREEIHILLSNAILSPSAFNIQHWRFVLVQDPTLRKEIKALSWEQAQITDASLLLILCADMKAWEKEPKRYWQNAPLEVQEFILPAIDSYYRDKEQVQRDEVFRSCGIVAQTIMLGAKEMGYDSCPMVGFDFDGVAKLISLPKDHVISMFITIGKATQEASPRAGQLPLEKLVIVDKF